jgi:two-component system sensor histidine kinase UhpB
MVEGAKYEATRLGLELIVNDSRQVLGVLDVQSETAGALSAEDQLLLEGLCGQIAVAINQRRVEAERAQSEARTQLIIDSALDPVITIDAAGVITGWNPQAEAVFGWSQAEALGQTLAETIIPPQYREAHMRGLKHFLATGEGPVLNRRIEITALRRDGSEFPVDLAISPVRTGETFTFTAFIRDITERKQAEETLRQSEERYRTVLQESPDAMMIYDLEGRATYINPSFTHIFGWSAEEWLGKRIDFVPEEEKAKTQESIRETFRQGRISIESRRYTKSGKIIDVWGTASLLKNEDGNPAGILVSVRDITERKRIEAEAQQRAQFEHTLRNITDKLRAASNVEQLVAIAAEELGQRLSASYAELELGITAGSNGYPMPAEETDAKTGQARKI